MEIKYIITKYTPILFNATMNHVDVAQCAFTDVVSAGFVTINIVGGKFNVHVRGKSVSLNLNSRHEDAEIIKRFLEESTTSFLTSVIR